MALLLVGWDLFHLIKLNGYNNGYNICVHNVKFPLPACSRNTSISGPDGCSKPFLNVLEKCSRLSFTAFTLFLGYSSLEWEVMHLHLTA